MRYLALISLVLLMGCGADGEPVQPTANLGLGIGPNGINPSLRVGTQAGPVAISIGL